MLSGLLFLVCFLFYIALTQTFPIQIILEGCTDTICTAICRVGLANCDDPLKPKCEYGYFKYTLKSGWDCVQCPYSEFNDPTILNCMDCKENPLTWELSRKCTYYYQIQNGNPFTGTYIRKNMDTIELYYIGTASTPALENTYRSFVKYYETYQCIGCDDFCEDYADENCNFQNDPGDLYYKGIICADRFYFDEDSCTTCSIQNCLSCSDSISCDECILGYSLNSDWNTCTKCITDCNNCIEDDEGYQYCSECVSDIFNNYKIYSLDQTECLECAYGCARCEYISIESTLETIYPNRDLGYIDSGDYYKYVKKCHQCLMNRYIVSNFGEMCQKCEIDKCEQCYYKWDLGSTLELSFIQSKSDSTQQCLQCAVGYKVSADEQSCTTYTKTNHCVSADKDGNCLKCDTSPNSNIDYVLELFDLSSISCNVKQKCTDKLENCLTCIGYLEEGKPTFNCIKCKSGYYPDFNSGLCYPCQSYCTTCWQYTDSYNITEYITQQTIGRNKVKYDADLDLINQETFNDVMCTQCQNGFELYDNVCMGCTQDCQIKLNSGENEVASACQFLENYAYCSQCFNPFNQKSLTTDMSTCQECPDKCLACRERTQEEINLVNPFFSPETASLKKFGQLCYKLQNTQSNQLVYLDTTLGIPVSCTQDDTSDPITSNIDRNKKCKKSITYKITISCDDSFADYTLSSYYKKKGKSIVIKFDKLEKASNYLEWNMKTISQIQLDIEFISNTLDEDTNSYLCSMTKATSIVTDLQKNIFSLQTLNIKLTGITPNYQAIDLRLAGQLTFENYASVQFENINIMNNQAKDFGITVIGKQTEFQLTKSHVRKNPNLTLGLSVNFALSLQNTISITLNEVIFEMQNFKSKDILINQTKTTNFEQSLLSLNDVTIQNSYITNSYFYLSNFMGKNNQIVINQFTIKSSEFENYKFFSDVKVNNLFDIQAQKILITQSWFIFSSLINSEYVKTLDITDCQLAGVQLSNTSILIYSNSIKISNIYLLRVFFETNSILIKSANQIHQVNQSQSIKQFTINFATMQNMECRSINCLFYLSTPINDLNIKSLIILSKIQIHSLSIGDISSEQLQSVQSALIYISETDNVNIQDVSVTDTISITIFYFSNIKQFYLLNALYDWTKSNQQEKPSAPPSDDPVDEIFDEGAGRLLEQAEIVIVPVNNLMPVNFECANRKLITNAYSYYFIYISNFQQSIQMDTIEIRRQLFIDASAIFISSYDILEQISKETITISYLICSYNNLVTLTNGAEMSLIQITSTQTQDISIRWSSFTSNHMHQIATTQTGQTPMGINIKSPQSTILLLENNFSFNRATQTGNGLIYIWVSRINMTSCNFEKTNQMDTVWLDRIEESQLINENLTNNLQSYFQIYSQGSNLYAIAKYIDINLSKFSESYGIFGSSIYAKIVDGYLNITNSSFINILGSLQPQFQSEGGCLFVNSDSAQLILKISRTEMQNCTARKSGGCIYIAPTKFQQQIDILDSTFIQCQSLESTFIQSVFLDSVEKPKVTFDNVIIMDNNYQQFIQNLPGLSLLEQLQLIDTSSIYFQNTGNLIMKNTQFTQIKHIAIIKGVNLDKFIMDDCQIYANIIFIRPLFEVTLQYNFSIISIVASGFQNNTSFEIKASQTVCSSFINSQIQYQYPDQTCDVIQETYQLFSNIELYYEKYYDDISYQTEFNDKTYDDKYQFPSKFSIYQQDQAIITQFYFTNQSASLLNCVLELALYYFQSSIQNFQTTSIFYISTLSDNSGLTLDKVTIQNNDCKRCLIGLFSVQQLITSNEYPFILIDHINCANNLMGYYGCLSFTTDFDQKELIPEQNMINKPVGTRILQLEQIHYISINNSQFINNIAKVGAGINVVGISTLIVNTKFISNQASLIGGGIFFSNLGKQSLFLKASDFIGNHAQIGAGLYLNNTELAYTERLQINFNQNEAIQGQNTQEQTMRQTIQIVEGQYLRSQRFLNATADSDNDGNLDSTTDVIKDNITIPFVNIKNYPASTNLLILPSGQKISAYKYFYEYTQEYVPMKYVFRIINLNRYSEPIINDQDTDVCNVFGRIQNMTTYDLTIGFTKNFTYPTSFSYSIDKGGYDLDDMIIYFDPKIDPIYYLELKFICDTVKLPLYNPLPPYEIIGYNSNYELYVHVRTFPCQKGEIYSIGKCLPCDINSNQYSVTVGAEYCSQMNSDNMESIAQSSIKLKPGFWRPDYNNDQSEACSNYPTNCLGGWVPGDPSCYTGHIGGLCESCDLYATIQEEAYTQSSAFKCAGCKPTEKYNLIILIATSIVSFISMVLAVKGSYEESQNFIMEQTLEVMGVRLKSSASDLATLMKVLTNYFQIVQFISSFQISIPSSLTSAAQTAGNPTESTTSSMDCLFVTMSDMNVLYFRMVWALIQPSIYLIGFYVVYFFTVLIKVLPFKLNIVTTAIIYEFLLLQPSYVDGFIVLASQRTISGYPYVQKDVAYRYDSDEHSLWMAKFIGPMLFIWALFLPLLLMGLLWRNRKTLNEKFTRLIYGFFYSEYETNSYLWEFIKIFQKEFMVIILAYYDEKVLVKGLLLVLVMFLYGAYQVTVSPYKNNRLNNIDMFSTIILAITLCLGVLLKATQDQGLNYLFIIVVVIIIFINIPFLLAIIYYIFEGYLLKFGPILDIIRDKINENSPELSQKHPFIRKLLINQAKMAIRVKQLWGVLRENVQESNIICKQYGLKFSKVFPPYSQNNTEDINTDQILVDIERTPLIDQTSRLQDGSVFQGTFRNNAPMNSGILYSASGIIQQGTFLETQIHGVGKEQWPDQTIYEGNYINGKKTGKGSLKWPLQEGDKYQEEYVGNFENDLFNGYGVYKWADGKTYEGEWKDGKRNGQGKYISLDKQYQGSFNDDQYHGKGTLIVGQKTLIGNWNMGKLEGIAIVKYKHQSRQSEWKEGKFVKWID